MNRQLCIAGLFTALVIATAMLPLEAGAASASLTGPLVEVFNCSSGFAATGSCGVALIGHAGEPFGINGSPNGSSPGLSRSQLNLIPANAVHAAININYQTKVNVQQFSATFTYVPNGSNIAFILNNSTTDGFAPNEFSGGATCEAGFFQGYAITQPINNVFAIDLDQWSSLRAGGSTFTYSGVQYYTGNTPPNPPNGPGQNPCNPSLGGALVIPYVGVNKISTSPVPLNSPANAQATTTRDTYSVTITYDGRNLTINLYDVTKGGSCPGSSCFTHTWTNVNIPAIVGGKTAWVGIGASTGAGLPNSLLINTWSYGIVLPTR